MKIHQIVLYVKTPDSSVKDAQRRITKFFDKQVGTLAQHGFDVQATGRITNFNVKNSGHPSMQPKKRTLFSAIEAKNDE